MRDYLKILASIRPGVPVSVNGDSYEGITMLDGSQKPTLAEFAAEELPVIRLDKIAGVKVEAQRRIFARYPQWKQANLHGRTTKLLAIEAGKYRDGTGALQSARALTVNEIQEIADASVAMAWIESVRAASGLIESDINAATDPASFDVAGSPRWPA